MPVKTKPKRKPTLPSVPSKLLRLAMRDLRAVEKDKRYRVNMRIWHSPDGGNCEVCMAGSVMACTLKVRLNKKSEPPSSKPTDTERIER